MVSHMSAAAEHDDARLTRVSRPLVYRWSPACCHVIGGLAGSYIYIRRPQPLPNVSTRPSLGVSARLKDIPPRMVDEATREFALSLCC